MYKLKIFAFFLAISALFAQSKIGYRVGLNFPSLEAGISLYDSKNHHSSIEHNGYYLSSVFSAKKIFSLNLIKFTQHAPFFGYSYGLIYYPKVSAVALKPSINISILEFSYIAKFGSNNVGNYEGYIFSLSYYFFKS